MVKKSLPKLGSKKKKQKEQLPTRITNDTVAEHRERILAGGRRHKYPIQYTRHRLIWNTILISLGALVVAAGGLWVQLYVVQDTSNFAYRITRVLPLPVASIDGRQVAYSDYLLYHRSTMAVLDDRGRIDADKGGVGRDQIQFQKRQAIDRAAQDTYAQKILSERNLSVSDEEVQALVENQQKASGLSEDAYAAVIQDRLHWSMDEYRLAMQRALVRQAAAFAIDSEAEQVKQEVEKLLGEKKTFDQVAKQLGNKVQNVKPVTVARDNSDGLSSIVATMKEGEVSSATKTLASDGYYFIQRFASDEGSLRYAYLRVPLTAFKQQFETLKQNDRLKYYIDVK